MAKRKKRPAPPPVAVELRRGSRAQPHGKRRLDRYNTQRKAVAESCQ